MAIKILISGYENSGKTTLISKIEDALIINCDGKEFSIPKIHANFKEYTGFVSFSNFISDKMKAYKAKYQTFPKYLIIDTITQLYSKMVNYNANNFNGFDIHSQNNKDTLAINDYLENIVIANGVNVIVVAHTKIDEKTGKHIIPAQGNFKDCGSFLSICNEAFFIEKTLDDYIIHLKSRLYPARSLLDLDKESMSINEFDINEYLEKITSVKNEAEKFRL